MHISSSYPLYCLEARRRWYDYPPPYKSGGNWYYATPWLWYDGDPHGSYTYSQWQTKIVNRMGVTSSVTVMMWGDYTAMDGSGTVYAQFRNDGATTLNGTVFFAITEDSLYYPASNGDVWHNHVARDYLPNELGIPTSIAPGDSAVVSQPFVIQPAWDEDMCTIITWFQDNIFSPDSVREVWQGGMKDVMELVAVKERDDIAVPVPVVYTAPNPTVTGTAFHFNLPGTTRYTIEIYDIAGRCVRSLSGIAIGEHQVVTWDRQLENGGVASSGVYFYRFSGKDINETGKIVLR